MSKGTKKLLVFAVIALAVVLLNHYFGWSARFAEGDWYARLQKGVEENFLEAALLYIALTAVASVLLAVPGVTFAIIAGAVFGPWWGTLFCVIGATLGAIASFLAGRFFLREGLRDKIAANRYVDRLLFNTETKNEMLVLMVTRLVPLFPYNLQNFAYGITDISLSKYALGSFLFMIPGTAMYTIGTSAVTDSSHRLLYLAVTLGIAVVVILLSRLLRRKYVEEGEKDRD